MKYLVAFCILFSCGNIIHAQNDVPLTLYQQFNGKYGYTIIGNTQNEFDNYQLPPPPCQMITQSSAGLNLNVDQTIEGAYLYWAGIGDGSLPVNLQLNGNIITPDLTFISDINSPFEAVPYFSSFKNITSFVQQEGNINYTVSNLNLNSIIDLYCSNAIYFSGWTIIVVYEDFSLPSTQTNIYHGLKFVGLNTTVSVDILINNLNIIDPQGASMSYVGYNGSPNIFLDESILFNGNTLSNALNPPDNPFNGSNSFTGSTTNWNQDIDTFDISSYINVDDTQANIKMNSFYIRFISSIVTSIRSELPDATALLTQVTGQELCDNRDLVVDYTIANTNSNASLPANVPISFYADNTLLQTVTTATPIAIGGSLDLQSTLSIPLTVPNTFTLKIVVDNTIANVSSVAESNESNNEDLQTITLVSDGDITPIFTLQDTFCEDGTVASLPAVSDNGISGSWSPSVINNQTDGSYVFTPNAAQCASPFTLDVTISPNASPIFNLQDTFCQGDTVPNLPLISANAISGTWSPSGIDNQMSASYMFTPTTGQCAIAFTLDVMVSPTVTPSFALQDTFCQDEPVPNLPSVSNNGIAGSWLPTVIDNQTDGSYVFTPSTGQCASAFTLDVTVSPTVTPKFSLPTVLCQNAEVPNLPTSSDNAISGSWSPNVITNQGSGTYVFTPSDGQCALAFTLEVTISPNVTPSFTIQDTFCRDESVPSLPTSSNNSILGSWSPSSIDNQASGSYLFTPNSGQCALPFTLDVMVSPNVIPVFSIENTYCQDATVPNLPTSSNNAILGSWSPISIDNQTDGTYVFTPSDGQCALPFTLDVTIALPTLTIENVSICEDEDGNSLSSILLDTGLGGFNFTFAWFENNIPIANTLSSLTVSTPGGYEVIATPVSLGCEQQFQFLVTALQPLTADYIVSDDFEANQTIAVEASGGSGSYLYSFEGLPFQQSPVYTVLDGGAVSVIVKDVNGCYETSTTLTLWQYPRFFTPNGDTYNDTWGIKTQQQIRIEIFDRYGKLLKTLLTNDRWDGTYNSQSLPANDYWFVLHYKQNRTFKSHFTLKR
ncbi:T9SS type B sorting domain-containing protein [Subsaximicrobium wynnwilliamsii]|uniref:T9SS type B sorting domain-containing protein n=1 Tax=Subsaximicrobium wynnwilliamsii TaxID=291179 RepID=A0A5C6ZRI0_9FLAO|nr:T9SS type B sorting domain-containing protein [Subsaximicrobium wynnwilliamsii]TXD85157.1 T9SS type B sorting domain-containing protein [Subsaximicrobium wynnwilliamsii]TXD91200.1 T9SS type B sorting domain-containing protein [Subsaximicrobium wynnwilliamsii]TXE04594.1 T9SS type B sorting domain-containing protein [Subsaximicrobium wynnwilliamsii]